MHRSLDIPNGAVQGRLEMGQNDIKLMEAAIAVAEELNFSRAARKLHITQPALTKRIAELEDRLGIPLFPRDHQMVEVNESARAFVEEARMSVLHAERAFQAARRAARGVDVVLNVGKSPYTDPFLVSTLMSIRLPLFPHLRVDLTSQFSCELVHQLLRGSLDLAIATEPPESPLMTTVKIGEAPFYIAMSERDKLAACRSLSLGDMGGRCWLLFERRLHPPLYDAIMRRAEDQGVSPSRVKHFTVPEEAFPSVADGSCVAFLVKVGALLVARHGVTVRPLNEDTLLLKTFMASRADNSSKVASELVRAFMRKLSHLAEDKQLSLPISA
jgi:DNA-binding transcriptional LysR family regulator